MKTDDLTERIEEMYEATLKLYEALEKEKIEDLSDDRIRDYENKRKGFEDILMKIYLVSH